MPSACYSYSEGCRPQPAAGQELRYAGGSSSLLFFLLHNSSSNSSNSSNSSKNHNYNHNKEGSVVRAVKNVLTACALVT